MTDSSIRTEAGIKVLRPGLLTTIQDLGRDGYRSSGIAAGGAMDRYALRMANLLVGNEEGEAGLEVTLVGPELEAGTDLLLSVCGAYLEPTIDGEELPMWRPVFVPRGAVLRFGRAVSGCRAYVAAAGGFGVPRELGSRSTDARAALGGLAGRRLAAGDALPCGAAQGAAAPSRWAAAWATALARQGEAAASAPEGAGRRLPWAAAPWFAPPGAYGGGDGEDGIVLRAMPGSEHGQFSAAAREALYRERYTVAPASDRMGCRLTGTPLARESRAELLSHGVTPGAVQVPPGGGPIILAADCQTTGGYPKIAHVATVDMPLLAQAKPGDTIRFQPVTLGEAQRLDRKREQDIRYLAAAIRSRQP
ncbi:biotin-dependent carboxyltransferase family protein [Paenibacillus sp. BK720]|uniref:5-oxoprolinase subunit C family protein n=1 Tax=Paenibacillus sp. BK720 TaxID=2587092 RepID=UPI00142030C6|nr:biotin-dependent carboxyltransferase family protein [Paenibacillus sp. BK720]